MAAHTAHQTGHSDIHTGQPRIKVPYSKKEADTRAIDLRLLLDERRSGAFRCVGCSKPMVMRELFANGDRVYQCLNGDCVKRIIRYQYQSHTGRIVEVA